MYAKKSAKKSGKKRTVDEAHSLPNFSDSRQALRSLGLAWTRLAGTEAALEDLLKTTTESKDALVPNAPYLGLALSILGNGNTVVLPENLIPKKGIVKAMLETYQQQSFTARVAIGVISADGETIVAAPHTLKIWPLAADYAIDNCTITDEDALMEGLSYWLRLDEDNFRENTTESHEGYEDASENAIVTRTMAMLNIFNDNAGTTHCGFDSDGLLNAAKRSEHNGISIKAPDDDERGDDDDDDDDDEEIRIFNVRFVTITPKRRIAVVSDAAGAGAGAGVGAAESDVGPSLAKRPRTTE